MPGRARRAFRWRVLSSLRAGPLSSGGQSASRSDRYRAQRHDGDVDELASRSWASWRAFPPDEPDADHEGWEWYHNVQRQPLYGRYLEMVAVAPCGDIASFSTIWNDDATRSALAARWAPRPSTSAASWPGPALARGCVACGTWGRWSHSSAGTAQRPTPSTPPPYRRIATSPSPGSNHAEQLVNRLPEVVCPSALARRLDHLA